MNGAPVKFLKPGFDAGLHLLQLKHEVTSSSGYGPGLSHGRRLRRYRRAFMRMAAFNDPAPVATTGPISAHLQSCNPAGQYVQPTASAILEQQQRSRSSRSNHVKRLGRKPGAVSCPRS